jgi:hypothetical protein
MESAVSRIGAYFSWYAPLSLSATKMIKNELLTRRRIMTGVAPYVACNFAMFEGLKDTLTDIDGNPPSTLEKLIAGGIAGAFSQTITYPLDVLRRRMQVASMSNLDYHYSGAWDCVFKMIKYEGKFLHRCVQAIPTERVLIEILIL